MEWNLLTKIDGVNQLRKWTDQGYIRFEQNCTDLDIPSKILNEEYQEIRRHLKTAYYNARDKARKADEKRVDYLTDLYFALDLYRLLDKYGMNVRIASNDRVWIYLTIMVIPDLVFDRFGKRKWDKNQKFVLSEERFCNKSRRIYPKTLWWYIYLSLQTDREGQADYNQTLAILFNNTTDTVVQLIERSGKLGYRVEYSRALMKYYGEHSGIHTSDDFRRVMVLNTARAQVIEPGLAEDGVIGYVKELFESLDRI